MENLKNAIALLRCAYGEHFTNDKVRLIRCLLTKRNRTLNVADIEEFILTSPFAPSIPELYKMSIECPEKN